MIKGIRLRLCARARARRRGRARGRLSDRRPVARGPSSSTPRATSSRRTRRTVSDCNKTTDFPWQDCADTGSAVLNARVVIYDVLERAAVLDPRRLEPAYVAGVEHDHRAPGRRDRAPQRGTVDARGRRVRRSRVPVRADGPSCSSATRLQTRSRASSGQAAAAHRGPDRPARRARCSATPRASVHARRIRRLERAAERIAGGHFDEPVVDAGTTSSASSRPRSSGCAAGSRSSIARAASSSRTPRTSCARRSSRSAASSS